MIVSIILPIRNEQKFIGKTLDSILAQNFIGDLEIIIADGMSDDGTLDIIQKYQEKNKYIKIVKNFDRVVPVGFNKALTISSDARIKPKLAGIDKSNDSSIDLL